MSKNYKIQQIDKYIEIIKQCYLNSESLPIYVRANLYTLDPDEQNYLTAHLQLEKLVGANEGMGLHKLFREDNYNAFARNLLNIPTINFSINAVDENGNSLFQILLEKADILDSYFKDTLYILFKRGYKSTPSDEIFLSNFFHLMPHTIEFQRHWCTAKVFYKLNDCEKIYQSYDALYAIFTIASFKLGKPFGYRFPNLLAVANNALEHYKQFGEVILEAIHHYKVYSTIKELDKKGTFQSKIDKLKETAPPQNHELLSIIWEIYPELKKENNTSSKLIHIQSEET